MVEISGLEENFMESPIIILVAPQLGENIGMSARAMHNCNFSKLRLVAPRDSWPNPQAIATSVGATHLLDQAEIFTDLQAAIKDCHYIVALTARLRVRALPRYNLVQASDAIRKEMARGKQTALLFGPERSGLDNDSLCCANAVLHMELNPDFPSLNLSQAVLLFAYYFRTQYYQNQGIQGEDSFHDTCQHFGESADRKALLNFFTRLEASLTQSGFFTNAEKKPELIRNLRSFFTRAAPTLQELRTLHGVVERLKRTYFRE